MHSQSALSVMTDACEVYIITVYCALGHPKASIPNASDTQHVQTPRPSILKTFETNRHHHRKSLLCKSNQRRDEEKAREKFGRVQVKGNNCTICRARPALSLELPCSSFQLAMSRFPSAGIIGSGVICSKGPLLKLTSAGAFAFAHSRGITFFLRRGLTLLCHGSFLMIADHEELLPWIGIIEVAFHGERVAVFLCPTPGDVAGVGRGICLSA